MAVDLSDTASNSVGSVMPAKSLELRHTIQLIRVLDTEIEEIEAYIQSIMNELHSTITTILGIDTRMGDTILAEVGDFSRFDSPDKLLAYAGLLPYTYQSGQLKNCYTDMEKRGSGYLCYATRTIGVIGAGMGLVLAMIHALCFQRMYPCFTVHMLHCRWRFC